MLFDIDHIDTPLNYTLIDNGATFDIQEGDELINITVTITTPIHKVIDIEFRETYNKLYVLSNRSLNMIYTKSLGILYSLSDFITSTDYQYNYIISYPTSTTRHDTFKHWVEYVHNIKGWEQFTIDNYKASEDKSRAIMYHPDCDPIIIKIHDIIDILEIPHKLKAELFYENVNTQVDLSEISQKITRASRNMNGLFAITTMLGRGYSQTFHNITMSEILDEAELSATLIIFLNRLYTKYNIYL